MDRVRTFKRKLTIKNNWESFEFFADSENLGFEPKFDRAWIVFNTGEQRIHDIYWKKETIRYNDMGNPCEAIRNVPYIKINYSSNKFDVDLTIIQRSAEVFI